MEEYDFEKIEAKWQDYWIDNGFYRAPPDASKEEKRYVLDMFAYTSGSMHVGHARTYSICDVIARYRKDATLKVSITRKVLERLKRESCVSSATASTVAKEESFSKAIKSLPNGGRTRRTAWGRMICRMA